MLKLRLIYKLLAGFGMVVVLVLGLLILGDQTIRQTSTIMQQTITQKIGPLAQINHLQSRAALIRRLELEMSRIEDVWAVAGIIDRLKKEMGVVEQDLQVLDTTVLQQDQEEKMRLSEAWHRYRAVLEEVLQACADMKMAEAGKLSLYSSLPKFQIFNSMLEQLSSQTAKTANQEYQQTLLDLQRRRMFFLWTSAIGTGLVALFALWFSRSLSLRIMELNQAARQLSQGHFGHLISIKGKDEIADLASSFNDMRIQLKSRAEALQRHQEHLEELVEARTADLAAAKQISEAATRAKSDFLARMSHEIRTPINAVTGLIQVVLKSELTAEQRDFLGKAQIASGNLLEIINDILDFSKIEAGRLDLECTPFYISDVMERLADLFTHRVAQKDLELIFSVAPRVPRKLKGDPARLSQVLTNLIENAVKYTDSGEIVVAVDVSDQAEKPPSRTGLKFWVSDTGIGIAPELLDSLFEPFTQAAGYMTREHEGTGLGLAICQRLVELMGGAIRSQSTPGKGSTFFFTVWLEAIETELQPFVAPPDLNGLKTLVADDSAYCRQMLCDILESFGFETTAVADGQGALDELSAVAQRDPYRLVLLDWKMSGLDGLQTAAKIRAQMTPQSPIIIMVTAYGLEIFRHRKDADPMDAVLLKPIKASALFNTIMTLFGRKESAATGKAPQPATSIAELRGRRILVVEDSAFSREVAVALLKDAGIEVDIAENGHLAVEKVTASDTAYDAVLMDIQMPLMDGFQATGHIRDHQQFERLPIIALTAHAMKGEKEKCLAAGMNDYIPKPFDEQQLLHTLLKWIVP